MQIINLSVNYPDKRVFDNFSCTFKKGQVTAIMGDSGVGKTTLLNCIAGLLDYAGDIIDGGEVSYIFQQPRLIESATVMQNLLYVCGGKKGKEKVPKIRELLKIVSLDKEENTLVSALSGGMQSRVALARAFLYESDTLLMDEPFKSLDVGLATRIRETLVELLKLHPRTVILVTHDVDEAIELGDKIMVLKGRPAQIVLEEESKADGIRKKLFDCLVD